MCLFLKKLMLQDDFMAGEWRRLRLLENAVINYGGGLAKLQHRAEVQALQLEVLNPEAARLLVEVAHYLRDVALAGKLDVSFHASRRER